MHVPDFTYQFIIKLGYEILFAKHDVCFSLKKLQHVIDCHLQNQRLTLTVASTFILYISSTANLAFFHTGGGMN